MRSLLPVESFDLRPSNRYVLARVIPSCFCFAKMCLCQVSLLSRSSPRYLTLLLRGVVHCLYGLGGGGHFSLCSECYVDRLGFVSFHSPFLLTSFELQGGRFVVSLKQWLDHCPR
jgi:hypothetical protein